MRRLLLFTVVLALTPLLVAAGEGVDSAPVAGAAPAVAAETPELLEADAVPCSAATVRLAGASHGRPSKSRWSRAGHAMAATRGQVARPRHVAHPRIDHRPCAARDGAASGCPRGPPAA